MDVKAEHLSAVAGRVDSESSRAAAAGWRSGTRRRYGGASGGATQIHASAITIQEVQHAVESFNLPGESRLRGIADRNAEIGWARYCEDVLPNSAPICRGAQKMLPSHIECQQSCDGSAGESACSACRA